MATGARIDVMTPSQALALAILKLQAEADPRAPADTPRREYYDAAQELRQLKNDLFPVE